MGIGLQHEVKELVGKCAKTRVEIRIGDFVAKMSIREVVESSSGVEDDGGDSDKRGA